MKRRSVNCCLIFLFLTYITISGAEPTQNLGLHLIESSICGDKTVKQKLHKEINNHTRRDLGWRSFANEGSTDWERPVRVSKSMDIRFRWRIDMNNKVTAISESAKKLCQ